MDSRNAGARAPHNSSKPANRARRARPVAAPIGRPPLKEGPTRQATSIGLQAGTRLKTFGASGILRAPETDLLLSGTASYRFAEGAQEKTFDELLGGLLRSAFVNCRAGIRLPRINLLGALLGRFDPCPKICRTGRELGSSRTIWRVGARAGPGCSGAHRSESEQWAARANRAKRLPSAFKYRRAFCAVPHIVFSTFGRRRGRAPLQSSQSRLLLTFPAPLLARRETTDSNPLSEISAIFKPNTAETTVRKCSTGPTRAATRRAVFRKDRCAMGWSSPANSGSHQYGRAAGHARKFTRIHSPRRGLGALVVLQRQRASEGRFPDCTTSHSGRAITDRLDSARLNQEPSLSREQKSDNWQTLQDCDAARLRANPKIGVEEKGKKGKTRER